MCKICSLALLLALLTCASHGRRAQVPTKVVQDGTNSREHGQAKVAGGASHTLASLLVTLNPIDAFTPSRFGAQSPGGNPGLSNSALQKLHRLHSRAFTMNTVTPSAFSMASSTELPEDLLNKQADLGPSFGDWAYEKVSGVAKKLVQAPVDENKDRRINLALGRLQRDLSVDDKKVSAVPQLPLIEKGILGGALASTVIAFFTRGPVQSLIFDYFTPTLTIVVASVAFRSEYIGKFKVAQAKEITATSKMAAAQGEVYLSRAERVKSIMGICLGVSAVFAALALVLEPIEGLSATIYLLCPTITVLAAAVAALAEQETRVLTGQAIGVGARRFASKESVDRTWLSQTQQIDRSTDFATKKWIDFAIGFVLGPITGVFVPGSLAFKAVVVAALAAAQTAYYLANAEGLLAQASESVALKSRSSSVVETYAQQSNRNGAILVYTSAVAGLMAAVADFLHVAHIMPSLALSGPFKWKGPLLFALFPALGALVAAGSSISKSRCDINTDISNYAATKFSEGQRGSRSRKPFDIAIGLIRITLQNAATGIKLQVAGILKLFEDLERSLKGGSDGTPATA